MLNKKLWLNITFVLVLSGCAVSNERIEKNQNSKTMITEENNQEIDLKNNQQNTDVSEKNKVNDSTEKKLAEVSNTPHESVQKSTPSVIISDTSTLSTKAIPWSWLYSSRDSADFITKYKGYGFGDTSKKIIYLTFDEGYENGYTSSILNTLKANGVHVAFFVTKPYVTSSFNGVSDTELLKRMINEGHIIGNHSVQHKTMPTFTNETYFDIELIGVEDAVNSIPGCKMSKYFRPPEGTFSELSLYYTQKLGYKSIFYSFAYQDYNIDSQPDPETAKATILKNTRNGMICLLHAVSKTNATILDSLIKEWKSRGYEFKTLDDLPS